MTAIGLTPPSRPIVRPLCALAAGTGLLLSGVFAAAPPLQAQTGTTLKVMDWNIHHGVDTSNVNNLDRVVTWIVNLNADVVSLNEVEKMSGYTDNADQPVVLESALEARTGKPWWGCFAQRTGAATGQGNIVLSRIPIDSCDRRYLSGTRSAARATMTVNNVTVAVFSTHLDDASPSMRAIQVNELTTWAATSAPQRILMGDFNAGATTAEMAPLNAGWEDAWAAAVAAGTAVSYPANPYGNTRNSRIDYIWRSKGSTSLALLSAQVYDSGTVSDHRPLSATYAVGTPALTTPQRPGNLRVVAR
jgi:endonuclease/exonuclease/phosphatase family metal-dependent hydrolase